MTLIDILQFLLSLFAALLVFSVTIFVHELGHFLAARMKGLEVERFAIGFGPKILSFTRNGVEYSINWIPFGGYVALPQMAPMEMIEGENESETKDLPPISPWAKIVTAFWGPLFSFLLAFVCACLLFMVGKNVNVAMNTTQIGYVAPESPAAEAGILPGDVVTTIDGEPMERWSGNGGGAVTQAVLLSLNKTVEVGIQRGNEDLLFEIEGIPHPEPRWEGLRYLGFEGPANFARELSVNSILKGSPAELANLQIGDQVVAVNGETAFSAFQISDVVEASEGIPILLTILRDGKEVEVEITPQREIETDRIMLGLGWSAPFELEVQKISPFQQIEESAVTMYMTIRALISPTSGVGAKNMSGAVGILNTIRKLIENDFRDFLYFCVFLNINLAILNMLPLPVLDGGHIVFAIIEWFRKRPVDVRILSGINTATFVALLAFMLYVTFFDVRRIHTSYEDKKEAEQQPTLQELKFEKPSEQTP
ncbi:MAG: RIP metalloprotease RseP [Verrucomicrobiota bacterium]